MLESRPLKVLYLTILEVSDYLGSMEQFQRCINGKFSGSKSKALPFLARCREGISHVRATGD